MFNEINEGSLNSIVSRRFGMKGAAAFPAVAPELFPNITLENDRVEWGFLKGERIFARAINVNAVGAQFSHIQIRMASRNMIAVIERVISNTANQCSILRANADGGLVGWVGGVGVARDLRDTQTGSGSEIATLNSALAATGSSMGILNAVGQQIEPGIVMAANKVPLQSVIFAANTVNQAMNLTLFWRERAALPGELE
jgi:hypothetical protein